MSNNKTIGDCILEKLTASPNGASTREVADYCRDELNDNQITNKQISAKLSKMKDSLHHKNIGANQLLYLWSLHPFQ